MLYRRPPKDRAFDVFVVRITGNTTSNEQLSHSKLWSSGTLHHAGTDLSRISYDKLLFCPGTPVVPAGGMEPRWPPCSTHILFHAMRDIVPIILPAL